MFKDGNYAHPDDCQMYIICDEDAKVGEATCDNDFYFHPLNRQCVPEDEMPAECELTGEKGTTNTLTSIYH